MIVGRIANPSHGKFASGGRVTRPPTATQTNSGFQKPVLFGKLARPTIPHDLVANDCGWASVGVPALAGPHGPTALTPIPAAAATPTKLPMRVRWSPGFSRSSLSDSDHSQTKDMRAGRGRPALARGLWLSPAEGFQDPRDLAGGVRFVHGLARESRLAGRSVAGSADRGGPRYFSKATRGWKHTQDRVIVGRIGNPSYGELASAGRLSPDTPKIGRPERPQEPSPGRNPGR